jgi:hypothetical protein
MNVPDAPFAKVLDQEEVSDDEADKEEDEESISDFSEESDEFVEDEEEDEEGAALQLEDDDGGDADDIEDLDLAVRINSGCIAVVGGNWLDLPAVSTDLTGFQKF